MIAVAVNVTSSGLSPGHDHRQTHTRQTPPTKLRNFAVHPTTITDTFSRPRWAARGEGGRNRLQHRTQVDDVYNTKGVDSETNENEKKKSQILWAMCRDQVARASSVSPNERQMYVKVCVCVCICLCVCVHV
jgi:hypothetical protein